MELTRFFGSQRAAKKLTLVHGHRLSAWSAKRPRGPLSVAHPRPFKALPPHPLRGSVLGGNRPGRFWVARVAKAEVRSSARDNDS
jgi:hypothetical protein